MMKVKLIFFILLTMSLGFHVPSDAFAADGDVTSTVEINSSTANFPTLDNGDRLGSSLANIGDLNGDGVNDIASGTYWDDEGGLNRGAVHIMFMNADGSVDSNVVINDSTANGPVLANSDGFGFSVANIGDLDGDGVNDIAAGGIEPTLGGAPAAGEIYIMFMNTDGTPKSTVEIDKTTANGPSGAGGHFGSDIANIGDLNGDGVNDLAVGNYGDTGGGSAHIIFMNTDGTPKSSVEINSSTTNGPTIDDEDRFGRSVENIGDLNGDGVNDLAVGAEYDDMDENGNASGGDNRGAIHIMFMNTDGTPKSTVEINSSTANGPTIGDDDLFGASLANIGDLNGDGVNDIASGTQFDDEGGSNRGAVHIMFMNADGSVDSTVEINSSTTNGPTIDDDDRLGSSLANIGDSNGDGINDLAVGAHNDDEGGSNRGAIHIMYMVGTLPPTTTTTTTTTSSGGGGKNNCDSNGFGNNNSLRVYQVTYNIKTYEVQVQAYSTCGSVSAKMTTPMQQSILGLSTEQPYLDDMITIYSGFLDESDEKFHISVQNKKQSFTETFYIYDKSITKKYTGSTGYTSEQQGTALPTITSEQITVVSEPSVTQVVQTIEESIPIEEQILDEPLETPQIQSITYTHEPIVEEEIKPQCGVGTKLVDGICKIIKTDEPKFCFLFWCW